MSVQAFKDWFAVSPAACRALEALYLADGAILSQETLADAARQTLKGFRQSLAELRAAMDKGSIKNVHNRGYYITPIGKADCDRAIADAAQRAAA